MVHRKWVKPEIAVLDIKQTEAGGADGGDFAGHES